MIPCPWCDILFSNEDDECPKCGRPPGGGGAGGATPA